MSRFKSDSAETCQLLEKASTGDVAAFDLLFDRHRPALRQAVERRLSGKVCPRVDPSDVVQDTQLEAFSRVGDYLRRRPMPFWLWLLKTAHERVMKIERRHLRAAKRTIDREVPLPEQSSLYLARQLLADGPTPSGQARHRELATRVRQVLAQLSEKDREIVFLRNFEGLSNSEAACVLGVRPEAAKKRYTRALLRLQSLFANRGLTESDS